MIVFSYKKSLIIIKLELHKMFYAKSKTKGTVETEHLDRRSKKSTPHTNRKIAR